MTTILVLALEAALYPTLLAAVVLLMAQPRPARLISAYLAGGLTMSIGIGCVIVFALDGSTSNSQKNVLSWSADLAVGGLALIAAVALATRADERFRARRARRRSPEASAKKQAKQKAKEDREPWSQRILAKGSVPIVFLAALAINVPGAAYLIALKDIGTGDYGSGEQVALIVGFNLIMFALAEIPLIGLLVAPEKATALVTRVNGWFGRNGRQIAIVLCLALGVFLVIRGMVRS